MAGAVAQKREGQLLKDMQVMYYIVKHANETRSPITKSGLERDTTFQNDQGKWGPDKVRFNAAFDALIKGEYMKETSEKVKVGMFKSEHALEAVKSPGEQERSMRKDIEKVREVHSESSD
jgi:hypothetical protein